MPQPSSCAKSAITESHEGLGHTIRSVSQSVPLPFRKTSSGQSGMMLHGEKMKGCPYFMYKGEYSTYTQSPNPSWTYGEKVTYGLLSESLFEVRAVLLGRMGRHEHALELYIYKLKNYAKAEEYVFFSQPQFPSLVDPVVDTAGSASAPLIKQRRICYSPPQT
ncbi:hypothetical protein BD769DRAFT_1781645 [Suillus cothurnatus]|nr:hypothetical protein BD769DRAFT_1781645 [Suillus cothurnatus]